MIDEAAWEKVREYARQIVSGQIRAWDGGRKLMDVWEACGDQDRMDAWTDLLEYNWDWVDLHRTELSPEEIQRRETEIQNVGDAAIIRAAEQLLAAK